MGVPILSSMEVVQYGELDGIPLYCDKNAMESDGIVIFNKVKPHTDFRGPHESGLAKMIAIGIAKHKGAAMFHSFGFHRFAELIPRVAEIFVQKCPVVFGVGLVQNAYDDKRGQKFFYKILMKRLSHFECIRYNRDDIWERGQFAEITIDTNCAQYIKIYQNNRGLSLIHI